MWLEKMLKLQFSKKFTGLQKNWELDFASPLKNNTACSKLNSCLYEAKANEHQCFTTRNTSPNNKMGMEVLCTSDSYISMMENLILKKPRDAGGLQVKYV